MSCKSILTQEAKRRQSAVKLAKRKGKTFAAEQFGVCLSSIKRWCKKWDGTWQSLREKSHKPKSHPKQHTPEEENLILKVYNAKFYRYGWDGVYDELTRNLGYTRSWGGMYHAARRMGLSKQPKNKGTRQFRQFPERTVPGELVQIDVKYVPYNCMRKKEGEPEPNALFQYTAIDACTRMRFIYAFDEQSPANTIKFFEMLKTAFTFRIQMVQTDNGSEFTYRYLQGDKPCPFDTYLEMLKSEQGIEIIHKLIAPHTPWHNGKVERSHRNDQRYFYDHETFSGLDHLNRRMALHLEWSNNKRMRVLGGISPLEKLRQVMAAAA